MKVIRNERYGRRVRGPWLFGLVLCQQVGDRRRVLETRFFIVNRRDEQSLIPIILRKVQPGTTIYSDEWPAYQQLQQFHFVHIRVNHTLWYMDPEGNHLNSIEGQWMIVRKRLVKDMRGTTPELLPSYQAEFWMMSIFPRRIDFFNEFIKLLGEFYVL